MACSKPIKYDDLIDITRCEDNLAAFLRSQNVLFSFEKPCDRCGKGRIHLLKAKGQCDGLTWRCTNSKCLVRISHRKHSFFAGSKLSLSEITKIIYYWTYKYPQEIVLFETGLNRHTVVHFYNFLREVCSTVLEELFEQVGGPGKIVEIDESKFGKKNTIAADKWTVSGCSVE